jgi:hypothetical protein
MVAGCATMNAVDAAYGAPAICANLFCVSCGSAHAEPFIPRFS